MDITIENAKEILKKYLKNNKERLYHSIRVAKIAKILAQKNNEAVEDAVIAALLHDIGKSMTQSELLSLCASNETLMYDFEIFQLPNALHGKAGAIIFEKEFDIASLREGSDLPYTIEQNEDGEFVVEGPRIEKMLGYTNLESEKGFLFFQNFLKTSGILEELEKAGIQDGDTVRMYGFAFDYYK